MGWLRRVCYRRYKRSRRFGDTLHHTDSRHARQDISYLEPNPLRSHSPQVQVRQNSHSWTFLCFASKIAMIHHSSKCLNKRKCSYFVSHTKIELLWSKRHHGWCSVKIRIWDHWTIQRLKRNQQSAVEWTPEVVSVPFLFSYNLF